MSRKNDILDDQNKGDGAMVSLDSVLTPMKGNGVVPVVVCAIGIVLTLYSFVLTSVFSANIVDDEYSSITNNTVQTFGDGISDLKSVVRIVSRFLASHERVGNRTVDLDFIRTVPGIDVFDQLIWVYRDGNRWHEKTLYRNLANSDYAETIKTNSLYFKALEDLRVFDSASVLFVSDLPGLVPRTADGLTYKTSYKPFIVLGTVEAGNPVSGVVLGVSRLNSVLDLQWFNNAPFLSAAKISDLKSSTVLFDIQKRRNGEGDQRAIKQTYEIDTGQETWEISISFVRHSRLFLLENVAALVLLFGLCFTLIATLYVRSYFLRSREISKVYEEIEQKNLDLEQGVQEREDIFETLKKSEQDNRTIIDSVSDIIFELDSEGTLILLNAAWYRVTGFPVQQSLDGSLFDLLKAEDQNQYRKDFELLVQGQKEPYRSFTKLRTSNGDFRAVELAYSMIRKDETGQVRVVGTFTDIEERRKAERALSVAEQKYRAIVENAPSGIYQMTPEGMYLSANPAMARILGYDGVDDLLGSVKNANQKVYVSARDRVHFVRDLEEQDRVVNYETQVFCKDGHKIWISESTRLVQDERGNALYYEGSIEDITDRKKQEKALHDAKLNSDMVNRAKTEFLQNMSHELRTPLNAIIGFSEILKDEKYGEIAQREYVDYANDIYESGRTLLEVITEILDISRIEIGERELKETHIDLEKVAKTALDLFGNKIEANDMDITNMLQGIPQVFGEEVAVKQIVTNLISNAVKFTPSGGRLTLSYDVDAHGRLQMSFTDTGIGLDEIEIQKALSPFGQVDSELSREGSGAGLGLTLVKSLMDLHGGDLELFSQKGIGTTVSIVFPVERVLIPKERDSSEIPEVFKPV